mmetsp:Transcript_51855/g.93074  ORF Transcript_51855/g.93074 Transcript_51855/m.93074 type:complete len:129 (-) Transcript_51855:100-486(-)
MGNCQCEGTKPDEAVKFTPRPGDVVNTVEEKAPMQAPSAVSAQALKAGIPPELQKLQGYWQTENDRQLMGEVSGTTIIWDQDFNCDQSPLRVAGGGIEMELMGAVHRAVYEEPGRLKWSDGECWVRAP